MFLKLHFKEVNYINSLKSLNTREYITDNAIVVNITIPSRFSKEMSFTFSQHSSAPVFPQTRTEA